MPYIGRDLNRGNYLKLDDISSSFNSSTKTFDLKVGGSAFTPGSSFSILVSVGGVIQEPESAYQVNNSQITFANAPTAQDGFFCLALAVPLAIGVPGSGTVNGSQMAKPFNYDGFFYLDDGNNRVGINSSSPSETLDIVGNTKISGILTATSFSGPIVGNTNNSSGISTFYNLRVSNNLTVEGTTTTLDTDLTAVDRIEVGADSNTTVGVAITQSGTADILNLYDGSTEVFSVADGGTSTFTVGTNKTLQIYAASHNDESQLGAGIGFSRQSDGATPLSGIFGHSNSGLGVAARDHITFLTGGTSLVNDTEERVRITSDGKVGIGTDLTTTPSSILTVAPHNSTSGRNISIYTSGAVGNKAGLFFNATSGTGNLAEIQAEYKGTNQGELVLSTSMSKRLTINKDGNVGIGTDNPGSLLEVTSDSPKIVLKDTDNNGEIYLHNVGGAAVIQAANSDVVFQTPARETFRIASSGNVGIGTYTPSRKVHLHETSANTAIYATFTNGSTGTAASNGFTLGIDSAQVAVLNNYSSTDIKILCNGGERLRITSDGKILINQTTSNWGTTTANSVIQLKNGVVWDYAGVQLDVGHNYYYNSSGAYKYIRGGYAARQTFHNNTGDIAFWSGGTGSADGTFTWSEKLRIKSGGTIAIPGQGASNANPRLLIEDGHGGDNDFSISQYEDANGTYTLIGQNVQLDGNGNETILDSNHKTASIYLDARNNGAIFFSTGGTNTHTERVRINSSGNVQLGSAADPGNALRYLDVYNLNTGSSAGSILRFITRKSDGSSSVSADIVKYKTGGLYINNNEVLGTTGFISFGTGTGGGSVTERLRIDSNGKIKLITAETTDYLQYGNNPRLWLKCPNGINGMRIDASTTPLEIKNSSANGKSFSFDSNFNFNVNGDYSLSSGEYDSSGKIFLNATRHNGSTTVTSFQTSIQAVATSNTNNTGYLGLGASAHPDDLVILTDGKVGIGYTNPGQKLDVNGAVQASGGYYTAGHPIATYASFTDISGGSYATRLGSTGTSTLRHTQIYGGGNALATFDGVNYRLGLGITTPEAALHINFHNGHGSVNNTLRFTNTDTTVTSNDTIGKIEWETKDSTAAGVHAYLKVLGSNTGYSSMHFGTGNATTLTDRLKIHHHGHLTTYGNNNGNAIGMELRNNNTAAYSHAELSLTSQNATTSKIWCDVPNAGMRLQYDGGSTVKIDGSGILSASNFSTGGYYKSSGPGGGDGTKLQGLAAGSGTNVVDTGISVNQGNASATMLVIGSRNTSNAQHVQGYAWLLRFAYDGDHLPAVHGITGNSDFWSISKSSSNTLQITGNSGNWAFGGIWVT